MKHPHRNAASQALFCWKDELGKGRCVMLSTLILTYIINGITGTVFSTTFLLHNGINLVNIGIITFVPYIASCFAIFSPYILERFQKRKGLLAAVRLVYYSLYLLATTILPPMIPDPGMKTLVFVALTFSASIINALFSSGYTVWHLNFIPNDVRARYFSTSQGIAQTISCIFGLGAALIADALSNTPHAYTIIAGLRYFAYGLALVDILLLTRPKEFPYPRTGRPRIMDIFVKPLKHKKFMLTMLIAFFHAFSMNVNSAVINPFILQDVGVSLAYIQVINCCYPIVLIMLSRYTRQTIGKMGWIKSYVIFYMMMAPTNIAYAFVNSENYLILMTILRLFQHFCGAVYNIAFQNVIYLHAPREEQTNYVSFYTLVVNLGGFLGVSLGTAFVAAYPDFSMVFCGTPDGPRPDAAAGNSIPSDSASSHCSRPAQALSSGNGRDGGLGVMAAWITDALSNSLASDS